MRSRCNIVARARVIAALSLIYFSGAATRALAGGFVYESTNEFFTSGDFNGDGVTDVVVVDKTTGNARVGLADTNGVLTWPAAVVTGVENATGCAAEHFMVASRDTLAITAPNLSRVNLVDLLPTNGLAAQPLIAPSLGPHALAGLYSPLTPPVNGGLSQLLVVSSFNNAPAERLDLMRLVVPASILEYGDTNTFDRPNAVFINTNAPTFGAGLMRGVTDTLQVWQFSNSPPVVISLTNVPPGGDYCSGNFTGDLLPRFILYQPGTSNFSVVSLVATNSGFAFGTPLIVPVDEPIVHIYFLSGPAGGNALVQFPDGVQAIGLSNNIPVYSTKYQTGAVAGSSFTGVMPMNGQFALFDAPTGSAFSAHAQVVSFDGVHFTQRSTSNLSPVSAPATRADVWLFQLEPFVNRSPNFIASYASPTWSDGVTGLPGTVQVPTEKDSGLTNGLGALATNNLGAAPNGAAFGIGNQYNPAISIFTYSPPKPAPPFSVSISPASGSYGSPLTIILSSTAMVTVHFRVNSNTWAVYSAGFTITNDSTVQYYGTSGQTQSGIYSATYSLGRPNQAGNAPAPVQTNPGNTNVPPDISTNTVLLSDVGTIFYGRRSGNLLGTIWAIGLDGSADTYITQGVRPRLSRNGRWLAFLRGGDPFNNKGNVWLRDMQTGNEQQLLADANFIHGLDWLIDGSGLLLDYQCGIAKLSTNGLLMPLISADCYDGAPTPNPMNGKIAFHNLNPSASIAGIYTANADGSSRQRIESYVYNPSWPAWSTDGESLVYADYNTTNVNSGINLWISAGDGSDLAQITALTTTGDGFPHGAIWSPDNSQLIAAGTIFGTNGLWLIPINSDRDGCDGFPIRLPTLPGDLIDFAGSIVSSAGSNAVIAQRPGLFIRQTAEAVIVYWSTNFAGYMLQSCTNLTNASWSTAGLPYFQNGIYFEHSESRASLGAATFYRLHYTGAAIVSSTPRLNIQLVANMAVLSWPTNLAGFVLQSKNDLSPAIPWNDLSGPYATNATSYQFNEPINPAKVKLYRLRGPL